MIESRNASRANRVPREISYKLYTSFGPIDGVSQYLCPLEILQMQQINKYFYKIAVSRVQTRFTLRNRKVLLTRFGRSTLNNEVLEIAAASATAT